MSAARPPSSFAQGQDLQATFQQAQAAMAAGRFDEAVEGFTRLVDAVPAEAGLRLNLGMALSMAGRPREALVHLQAASESGRPELAPANLFLGVAHMDLGQPAQAVTPLKTWLTTQPDDPKGRQLLGEAFLTLGRFDSAVESYQALSRLESEDPRSWYGLGKGYEGVAEAAFQRLQREAPDSQWILLTVAEMMIAQERDKSAFQLYREALDANPGLPGAHEALAGIYEREGHPDWAAAERERAARAASRAVSGLQADFQAGRHEAVLEATTSGASPEALYWRHRSSTELARDAFNWVDALGPSPEATLIEVAALRGQRRFAESKEALQKALSSWPEDLRLRHELATLLFIAREYDAARPLLEGLLEVNPASAEYNLLLGRVWVEQRQAAKAIPYLERASKDSTTAISAQAALGRAYLDSGEAARAVPYLEAALETDEDGSIHFQLARAYQASGQTERARETRKKFQEIQRAANARAQNERDGLTITAP